MKFSKVFLSLGLFLSVTLPLSVDALYARPCINDIDTYFAVQDGVVIDSFRYLEASSGPCSQDYSLKPGSSFDQRALNLPDGVWVVRQDSVENFPSVTIPGGTSSSDTWAKAEGAEQLSADPADIDSYLERRQWFVTWIPILRILFATLLFAAIGFGIWLMMREWVRFVYKYTAMKSRILRGLVVTSATLPFTYTFWIVANLLASNVPRYAVDVYIILNQYIFPLVLLIAFVLFPVFTAIALYKKFKQRWLQDEVSINNRNL